MSPGRFRQAQSESEVKNLEILHPDLDVEKKHKRERERETYMYIYIYIYIYPPAPSGPPGCEAQFVDCRFIAFAVLTECNMVDEVMKNEE